MYITKGLKLSVVGLIVFLLAGCSSCDTSVFPKNIIISDWQGAKSPTNVVLEQYPAGSDFNRIKRSTRNFEVEYLAAVASQSFDIKNPSLELSFQEKRSLHVKYNYILKVDDVEFRLRNVRLQSGPGRPSCNIASGNINDKCQLTDDGNTSLIMPYECSVKVE